MRGVLKVCEDVTVTFETAQLQLLPDVNFQLDWLSSGFISTMEEQLRKHVHGSERPCALRDSVGRKLLKSVLQQMREGALKCHRLKVMRYSGYA